MFLISWILGTIFLWFLCGALKRVRVDDHFIYVSNYLREVSIPLSLIDDVTENRWINIRPVTVYFRAKTAFGNHIVFMPKSQFAFWRSHPVVEELKNLARR